MFRAGRGGETGRMVTPFAAFQFAVFDAQQDRVDLVVFAEGEENALSCARILLGITIARVQGLSSEDDDEGDAVD